MPVNPAGKTGMPRKSPKPHTYITFRHQNFDLEYNLKWQKDVCVYLGPPRARLDFLSLYLHAKTKIAAGCGQISIRVLGNVNLHGEFGKTSYNYITDYSKMTDL